MRQLMHTFLCVEAIEDSGLTEDQVSNDRTGLVIGAGNWFSTQPISGL